MLFSESFFLEGLSAEQLKINKDGSAIHDIYTKDPDGTWTQTRRKFTKSYKLSPGKIAAFGGALAGGGFLMKKAFDKYKENKRRKQSWLSRLFS